MEGKSVVMVTTERRSLTPTEKIRLQESQQASSESW